MVGCGRCCRESKSPLAESSAISLAQSSSIVSYVSMAENTDYGKGCHGDERIDVVSGGGAAKIFSRDTVDLNCCF